MKTVYTATNSVEAHMLLNLLEERGCEARLSGERLENSLGELPQAWPVEIQVAESDYDKALAILTKWEQSEDATPPPRKKAKPFLTLAIGMILGAGGTFFYFTQVAPFSDEVDLNDDGRIDQRLKHSEEGAPYTEIDFNFDGTPDYVESYSVMSGIATSARIDLDFDGHFETLQYFKYGSPSVMEIDADRDGYIEQRREYQHGTLRTITYYDPKQKRPIKREQFGPFRLESDRMDTTGNGMLDRERRFNAIGEPAPPTS